MSRILIVDDDYAARVLLQRVLEEETHDIAVAKDGVEGLELARQFQPELIICDWMMPRMDGLALCRQLKADLSLATSFFILLTSKVDVKDRIAGLDSGADDFLSKPIEVEELRARVRAGLRLQHVYQDLQDQKRMLEKEFAEAAEYVRSLLPPPMHDKVAIDSRFIPSRQLGGDCFDYYWLDPDYLAIYLLDVSGHGLGSALPSISVLNMLRTQSMDAVNFYQPSHVLQSLNEMFQMDDQNDKYFTIWYGVYNHAKRQLLYSSAGHPPALLLSDVDDGPAHVTQLRTSGLPIGMLPDSRYQTRRCDIGPPSSRLYIFSDGAYEIRDDAGQIWGLEAFQDFLVEQREAIAAQGLDYILAHIHTLTPADSLDDDLSLLRLDLG